MLETSTFDISSVECRAITNMEIIIQNTHEDIKDRFKSVKTEEQSNKLFIVHQTLLGIFCKDSALGSVLICIVGVCVCVFQCVTVQFRLRLDLLPSNQLQTEFSYLLLSSAGTANILHPLPASSVLNLRKQLTLNNKNSLNEQLLLSRLNLMTICLIPAAYVFLKSVSIN